MRKKQLVKYLSYIIKNKWISWCAEKKLTYNNYSSNTDELFVADYIISDYYYCIVFTTYNLMFDYLNNLSQVENKLFQYDGHTNW